MTARRLRRILEARLHQHPRHHPPVGILLPHEGLDIHPRIGIQHLRPGNTATGGRSRPSQRVLTV